MLSFRNPSLSDRAAAEPILRAAAYPGADYNFATLYLWAPCYSGVCITDTFLTQLFDCGDTLVYLYPACLREPKRALEAILGDGRERGGRLRFFGMTEENCRELESLLPGSFCFAPDRDHSDYLYETQALCALKGRKLQSRRNLCNRFEAEHPGWRAAPVTPENLPLCRALLDDWDERHTPSEDILLERRAISLCFDSFEALGADGLLLMDGDTPLAFSVGSPSTQTVFDVHFEKALPEIPGAYAMICREFARHIAQKHPGILYLNREDDMGEPNLRRAKLSYQPAVLLEKFTADFQEA